MNKNEFVNKLSLVSNVSKAKCNEILDNIYSIICESLKRNEEVNFKGFCKFYVKQRNERIISGFLKEKKLISNKNEPKVRLSKNFKNIIR